MPLSKVTLVRNYLCHSAVKWIVKFVLTSYIEFAKLWSAILMVPALINQCVNATSEVPEKRELSSEVYMKVMEVEGCIVHKFANQRTR